MSSLVPISIPLLFSRLIKCGAVDLGRSYLQVLARAHPSFSTIIHSYPYDMPVALFSKLKAVHDIQSAVRRLSGGGIHFDS